MIMREASWGGTPEVRYYIVLKKRKWKENEIKEKNLRR